MKSIFFSSRKIKPAITGFIIVALATVFIFSCNGNDATKKTDPATQQDNQSGEGEGEGERGMDSIHRGKGHAPNGMDTTHRRKHE